MTNFKSLPVPPIGTIAFHQKLKSRAYVSQQVLGQRRSICLSSASDMLPVHIEVVHRPYDFTHFSNEHCSLLNEINEPFQMQGRTFCCNRDALGEYRHICILCFFQWTEICPVFHVFFSLEAHMKRRVFADGVIAPFEAEKWPQGSYSFFNSFLFCY